MRRGQSTLEYILLIGIAAVALIAMLVYVSRGLQGNLRSQADQLGAGQYAPGNTTISNSEIKTVTSTNSSGSSTTVAYGNMNEPAPGLKEKMAAIQAKEDEIEILNKIAWEELAKEEGMKEAEKAKKGSFSWDATTLALQKKSIALKNAYIQLNILNEAANKIAEDWAKREITKDKTTTKSSSSESGTVVDHKKIEEALGDL